MANTQPNILKPICEPYHNDAITPTIDDKDFYIIEYNDYTPKPQNNTNQKTHLEDIKERLLVTDKEHMVVSFDSEWQTEGDRRHILSYQFTTYYKGEIKEFAFIPKTSEPLNFSKIFKVLGDAYNINYEQKGQTKGKSIPTYLIAHNCLCDITTLDDFKDIYKNLTGDKEVFSRKPSMVFDNDPSGATRMFNVSVIGTMNHFTGSLAKLGESINTPKIKLAQGVIENMKDYRENHFDEFMKYGMNDTHILMEWYLVNFKDRIIPITNTSLGERLMIEALGGETKAQELRGIKTEWEKDSKGKSVKKEVFVSPLSEDVYYKGKEAYLGGWNTSTELGIIGEKTTDYDLAGAYPTAAALIPNLDWKATKPKAHLENMVLTKDMADKYDFNNIGFGKIDFEFPNDVKYPCIPVPHKKEWIFCRKGEDVDVTWPEIKMAVNMGAEVKIKSLDLYHEMKDPKTGQNISYLHDTYKFFTEERDKAKQIYGKGSPQEVVAKLTNNGIYGKLAQGLKEKSIRDVASNEMKSTKTSKLTSPAHASHLTALIRCALTSTMQQLHEKGYKEYSVTTDGFISNAPLDEVASCDMYGLKKLFEASSLNLRGNDIVWEEKHTQDRLLNISTRTNIGLDMTNHAVDGGVNATVGYIGDNFVEDYLSRDEKGIYLKQHTLPSLAKMVYEGIDYVDIETDKNLLMNYDFKRKVYLDTIKDYAVNYEGKNYNVVNFDTNPYEDVKEWQDVQKTMDRVGSSLLNSRDYENALAPNIELTKGDPRSEILNGIYFMFEQYGYKRVFDAIGENEVIKSMNTAARNLGVKLDMTPTLLNEMKLNNKFDKEVASKDITDVFVGKVKESTLGKLQRDPSKNGDVEPEVAEGRF